MSYTLLLDYFGSRPSETSIFAVGRQQDLQKPNMGMDGCSRNANDIRQGCGWLRPSGHCTTRRETASPWQQNVACLFLGQFAALNTIAIVGELHLSFMVESSLAMCLLLINEARTKMKD